MKTIIFNSAILSLLIIGCGDKPTSKELLSAELVENPATASNSNAISEADAPVMTFEKDKYEFGKIIQGEKVTYSFKFKNTGKSDLIINSANATCGCTVPTYSKDPIKPGETGKVDVVFDSDGKKGVVNKTVTIQANTIPNTKILEISGEIITPPGSEKQ